MTSATQAGVCPPIELRHRLRIAREYAGLDQEQLADRIEAARSTVSNAETGKVKPRRMVVVAWAMACGVSREWLESGKDPEDDPDPNSGLWIIRTDAGAPIQQRSVLRAVQSGSEASNRDAA